MTTSLTVSLFIVPSDPVNLLTHMQLCSSEIPFDKAEWEKVWIRLSAHLQPFFWPIGRILTIFDKKYRILRVLFDCFATKQCLGMLWLLLVSLSGSLPVSLWLSMALCDSHSGSLWLPLALTYSLRLSLTLSGSYWISPCLSLAL